MCPRWKGEARCLDGPEKGYGAKSIVITCRFVGLIRVDGDEASTAGASSICLKGKVLQNERAGLSHVPS